jgi:hypothetical protein
VLDLLRVVNDDGRADPQYLAVVDNYRVINGYSGYAAPHLDALRQALVGHKPAAFAPFRKRSDVYVVVRNGLESQFVTWLESLHDAERLFDSAQLKVFRLRRVDSDAPPPMLLPLPKAGETTLTIDVN